MYSRFTREKQHELKSVLFVFICLFFILNTFAFGQISSTLPIKKLTAGMHIIQAEIAASPESRTQGLMHRKTLGTNDGMLFIFDQPSTQCFWMRNTFIPLSIAYLADDGTIINVAHMMPQSDQSHCSDKPVRFALEMNQGWFDQRGITPGKKILGLK